jgi:hypothetical protein
MSDLIGEFLEENRGRINALGHLAAVNQRNQQINEQRKQVDALRRQSAAIEEQNRLEQGRVQIEQQRLAIEKQRFAAEEAERILRREQEEQVRELRNLMADVAMSLDKIQKQFLS